jgi:hypothetical protein
MSQPAHAIVPPMPRIYIDFTCTPRCLSTLGAASYQASGATLPSSRFSRWPAPLHAISHLRPPLALGPQTACPSPKTAMCVYRHTADTCLCLVLPGLCNCSAAAPGSLHSAGSAATSSTAAAGLTSAAANEAAPLKRGAARWPRRAPVRPRQIGRLYTAWQARMAF